MKVLATIFLLIGSVVAQQSPAASSTPSADSNEQHARAILDQMVQALGGQAYLGVEDWYAEIRSGSFHSGSLVGEGILYRYWKWPNQERTEITKQRDIVQLYVGDKAYEITYRGLRPLDPAKDDNLRQGLQRRYYSLENVLRGWLNEKGTLLLYEGSALADARMADKITILNAKNESVTLLVAQDTHLPIEKRYSTRDPRYRDRDEESTIYGNWKVIQGVNTPRSTLTKRNGETISQQIILNITYNGHPPAAWFDPATAKLNPPPKS